MQPQNKFAEATKNTLLHIAELTRATTWLAEPTKQVLLPQTLHPTNSFIHNPSTHKGWA
jgi:hypothetical protein